MAGSNTSSIVSRGVGRPTKYDEESVKKLESIFKIGGTVEEACSYAMISKETFYNWQEKNPNLLTRIEQAKIYSIIAARNVIVDKIIKEKDDANARWWLERKLPNEFGAKNNQTNVQVNNIVPIMGGATANVSSNSSNEEASETEQTD